eukprot:TRINITY_DN336_c0_g1_i5.p1 TRINITY_DN336_c0_g1~~TRINITY_DN336_c0_g1_i5.p1  ORF type:complete len:223 (+),score=35.50 TRINITY_DN336_c0_g1_i5:220-888(+)
MAESGDDKNEHLYKILVVGDYAVGKTSLIRRYCHGYFTPNYKLTIGVDFALKVVDWDEDTKINLQLWDIAGHERFGYMTSVYYKYAIAAVIVFDLSRPATFDAVVKWKEDVFSKVTLANGNPIPVILLANKCDIPGLVIDREKLDRFCDEHGFIGWFETSAQNNTNIDTAMQFLIKNILQVAAEHGARSPNSEDTISLEDTSDSISLRSRSGESKGCCLRSS